VLAIERNEHVTDRRHGSYSANGWCLISGSLPFHKDELVAPRTSVDVHFVVPGRDGEELARSKKR
jgi:hypothetical protein